MDATTAKFEVYLKQHSINHTLKEYPMSVHTVEMAAGAVHGRVEDFIKTIILIDAKNETYAAILRGDDRISMSRMAFNAKLDGLRLAKQDEVITRTGYAPGGIPPFGFPARFIIDVKVPEMRFCWGGGGSDKSLVKLDPKDIIAHTNGTVVRITG